MNAAYVKKVMDNLEQKVVKIAGLVGNKAPDHADQDGIYQYRRSDWWTSGFWPGMLWILYDLTGDEQFKQLVWERDKDLEQWLVLPSDELNHDVGFQFLPTAVIKHTLTGDEEAKRTGIEAANFLAARFNPTGKFIRAWNTGPDGNQVPGWAIIDCLMNIPLLFWASRMTGDPLYSEIAIQHAETVLQYAIREDGSVNHILSFNADTGKFLEALGGQGAGPDSAWSRGNSWALYGCALAYRYTGDSRYLNASKRVAHYFIAALPEDHVPYWDFRLANKQGEPRDSSAGAIAASGLLELAEMLPASEKQMYRRAAERMLIALTENYAVWDKPDFEPILRGATGNKPLGHHVDYSLIFGDYYYLEAFAKLSGWKHRIF